MQQSDSEYRSPLVQAIEARKRNAHRFRVNDFLGLPGPQIEHIKIRVAMKAEEDRAVASAHRYVKELAGDTDAKNDPDILVGAKTCAILHTVCREGSDFDGHAFLSPEWMRDHLTTDHLSTLLNLYNEVRKAEGPAPKDLEDATVERLLSACIEFVEAEERIPQMALAACPREYLSEAFVMAAVKLDVARREADMAQAVVAKQRESIARLEAALKAANVSIPVVPEEPADPEVATA